MKKITDLEHKNEPEAEKVLNQKVESGGNVMIDKDKFTKEVDVLWVQTKSMRDKVAENKPHVFETDTRFGTQAEQYKLFIPVYHSNVTDKCEVLGLLFIAY